MTTWLSSDHHFFHFNILKYDSRPFATLEEMHEQMILRWNDKVQPADTVLYLGDFSLSKRALTEILPRLNGEIHLIAGNHDQCHPAHAKKPGKIERMTQLYLDSGFKSVKLEDEIQIGLHRVKLHHMPYRGDHTAAGERYSNYRPVDNGQWLLHGHVHIAWAIKCRMINVGAPVRDYAPISTDEVRKIIEENS